MDLYFNQIIFAGFINLFDTADCFENISVIIKIILSFCNIPALLLVHPKTHTS